MRLSVIISNRNDTSMLAVTVRSAIEQLKPLGLDGEVIVVDNSDSPIQEVLTSYLPKGYIDEGLLRLYYQYFPCLFTARETAIKEAKGEYIVCVDSHMLLGHNMLYDLVEFMDRHNHGKELGFAHAPISWMHQHERSARHDRDMTLNELGNWGAAYKHEQKMTWKGMPWICRKDFFFNVLNGYGALAKHKVSWGGGDMHIGIKPWLLGYPNWAVPCAPGIHCGPFPKPEKGKADPKAKYRLYSKSGSTHEYIGFLISFYVLGGEPMMERNKEKIERQFNIRCSTFWDRAKQMGQEEKDWLDSKKIITFEELLAKRPWDEYLYNSKSLGGSVKGAR
jgi:glycosyltransferase involved in cell wall biosynthesis